MEDHRDFPTDEFDLPTLQKVDAEIDSFDFRKQDIYAMMISLVPTLVTKARTASQSSDYAVSHRGFWVGASILAYDTDQSNPRIGIFTAGNFKAVVPEDAKGEEDVDDIPKNCAEVNATIEAQHNDFERVGMIVVSATANNARIEEVTQIASATLWPCFDCSEMTSKDPIFDKDTLLMSVGSGSDIFQLQNASELRARYKQRSSNKIPDELEVNSYSPFDWADREYAYRQQRRRKRLKANVYDRDKRRERQCRALAQAAMTDDL